MTPLYPVFLKLDGERALVVGGGAIAAEKARDLLAAGAALTVVAPVVSDALHDVLRAHTGPVRVLERAFDDDDTRGMRVVIAATDDEAVNRRVFVRAREDGALVNVVDVPDLCAFYTGGVVRRGPLTVVVGTSGASPSLARRVRLLLEDVLSPALAPLARVLGESRPRLLTRYPHMKARAAVLDAFVSRAVLSLSDDATDDEVRALVARELLNDDEGAR